MPIKKDLIILIVLSGTLSFSALAQNTSKFKEDIEKEVFDTTIKPNFN